MMMLKLQAFLIAGAMTLAMPALADHERWGQRRDAGTSIRATTAGPVNPPPGAPKFLKLPYNQADGITILNSWYYGSYSGRQSFCNHPDDIAGGRNHCSFDYVKRSSGRYVGFPVLAAADGLSERKTCSGCGTYLQITHTVPSTSGTGNEQWCSRYLHLDPRRPAVVGPVRQGQPIATASDSGNTSPIHLHWDVRPGPCSRWGNNQVDPFDIAGGLLRQGIAPTKEHYLGGSKFKGCGDNHLMLEGCPPPLPQQGAPMPLATEATTPLGVDAGTGMTSNGSGFRFD